MKQPLKTHSDNITYKVGEDFFCVWYTYHARTYKDDSRIDLEMILCEGKDVTDTCDDATYNDAMNRIESYLFEVWSEQ